METNGKSGMDVLCKDNSEELAQAAVHALPNGSEREQLGVAMRLARGAANPERVRDAIQRARSPGLNITAPVIEVRHADLQRASDESLFRSVCPTCKMGILLVRRDQETFALVRDDSCTHCGQRVHYTDATIAGAHLE